MAETARRLLDSLSSNPCLDGRQKEDGNGEVAAKVLVDYFMKRRRKQKMLCGQLQVLQLLLEFLQGADTASWEETSPQLSNLEVEEVKEKWKALKSEYQEKVRDVEEIIPQLLERIQLLHEKRTQLEGSLQRYHSQKAVAENKAKEHLQSFQEVVQKQQLVIQKSQSQTQQLKVELQKLEQSADSWIQAVSRDSTRLGLLRTLRGVSLVRVEEKELVLDLNAGEKTEILPLRVTLHLTPEEEFHVETDSSMPSLPPDLQHGATAHITPVILELQCWYRSHARLVKELRELQERFHIDWIPAERKLLLKESIHYSLLVEPGYPLSGGVRLMSVTGTEPCPSPDSLKPPAESPLLSDWLEYLHSSPHLSF